MKVFISWVLVLLSGAPLMMLMVELRWCGSAGASVPFLLVPPSQTLHDAVVGACRDTLISKDHMEITAGLNRP